MKKNTILMAVVIGLATSCSDFTDIEPKGKNLLSTTTQLDMLLNAEFTTLTTDMQTIATDLVPVSQNIPNLISQPSKTREALLVSFDDTQMDLLASLTTSDADCNNYYGYIGRIANPILQKVDDAEGSQAMRDQLKCEALVLRAYSHFILVNKFAKAYNPSTANTEPGIPYMTEEADITQNTEKVTVAEVYNHIIADLDEAIALDALPNVATNKMRLCKPCAYAAKALVLMSMQQYDEAAKMAQEALSINSNIDDYNTMTSTMTGMYGLPHEIFTRPQMECQEDLFYTYTVAGYPISTEAWDYFETGSICHDNFLTMNVAYDNMMDLGSMMLGVPYQWAYDIYSGYNGGGMKTTQMYLILAECALRNNQINEAMHYLDIIRQNRIATATYQPLEGKVNDMTEAIAHLKQTSHGENIFSVWNFINRKRWNQTDWKETFTRDINGTVYTLAPDSRLWVFPFPQNVTSNNSNITQNY